MQYYIPAFAEYVQNHQFNYQYISSLSFTKTPSISLRIYLYHTQIILQNVIQHQIQQNKYYKINFEFDLKFTLLRQVKPPTEKQKLGIPIGLKFQRNPSESTFEFFSDNKQQLIKWRDVLAKKLNQRGFQNLYKHSKKIGKGNSATVYLAERLQDSRKIAIKAFAKQALSVEPKGKQSLINEINILRSIDHECLMKLYEVFESQNSYYLIVQHLQGGQLFEKINNRKFGISQIQTILKRLVEGLSYLHAKKIIHRDLKPENLIFRTQGSIDIVISDFGLATLVDAQNYIFIRCGTPGYVAPQIINFKGKSGQETVSDIFSLGIIAHILGTGRSPFPGREYQMVLQQNRACNFNFNLEIYSMIQPSLLDLTIKMMEIDPKKRIKTNQILEHPFFQRKFVQIIEINDQQDFIQLVKDDNKLKQRKKIQDSIGSFVIGKPNILKGTDQEYNSMNSVGSSKSQQSVPMSPISIKGSKFSKRQREPQIESQFKQRAQPRKKIHFNQRLDLDDLRDKIGQQIKKQ